MNNKNLDRALKTAIVVLAAALVWVIAGTMQERIVVAGDQAPEFSITTDSGAKITPASFGGRVLVLNFWATWCAPCVQEMPSLNDLQKQLGQSGLVVLGVSIDRKADAYQKFLKRFQIAFQTARDPDENISVKYGTYVFPETYVIDRTGKVVQKFIGPPPKGWTDPEIVNYLKTLL